MGVVVEWFQDYRFTYVNASTEETMSVWQALNAAPFTFGQFFFTASAWHPDAGTGAIDVYLETSIDGDLWTRTTSNARLTPSQSTAQIILQDSAATASVPGLARLVRAVFVGADTTNGGAVTILGRAVLKSRCMGSLPVRTRYIPEAKSCNDRVA